jgi:uncharacterized membrane protein YkoI
MKKELMRQCLSVHALMISCAIAVSGPMALALADDRNSGQDERESAKEVYAGAKSGEIMPLAKILDKVTKTHIGEIVETKFEHKGGALIYEIYFLDDSGRRQEIYVDARTGELIKSEVED